MGTMNETRNGKHSMWVGIGRQVVSFIIGVVVAAFILGRNSQKINDVVTWKQSVAPLIEHMNRSGTVSFEHFYKDYEKQQARQDAERKDLEHRIRELEKKIDP
jgi:flagellar basal body-associated protein FliL